jgi:hypothetical protein
MIIEFSNAVSPKTHSAIGVAIVITACAFFFIPTTLIILGYYSSQPTGSLISPLPQGVLSDQPTPTPTEAIAEVVTPTPIPQNQPIIAADNNATQAATANVAPLPGSNVKDKTASIQPGALETVVTDPEVSETSQIYLSPRPGDKTIYTLKSKGVGEFTISVDSASDALRYIDYHIVSP